MGASVESTAGGGSWQVFISYAWQTNRPLAQQLQTALTRQGVSAYLDSDEIGPGEPIRKNVFEALLTTHVMVAFVDTVYFSRRYCIEEWTTALAAYRAIVRDGGGVAERTQALLPIVIAQPLNSTGPLPHIPIELLDTRWPAGDETEKLSALVRHRLIDQQMTFGARLMRLNELDPIREWLYRPPAIPVTLKLAGARHLTGAWEPDELERDAAWELFVELQTRVAVVEVSGSLRESLSSLYSLFDITRGILRKYGPSIGRPKGGSDVYFARICFVMLDDVLRPTLTDWHLKLQNYESQNVQQRPSWEHESQWEYAAELRAVLAETRIRLSMVADTLRRAAELPADYAVGK